MIPNFVVALVMIVAICCCCGTESARFSLPTKGNTHLGYRHTADQVNRPHPYQQVASRGSYAWKHNFAKESLNQKQIYQLQLDYNKVLESCFPYRVWYIQWDNWYQMHSNGLPNRQPTSIKNIISIANFYLTVHKTQDSILPCVSLALDSSIF